jgi:glycosyltransferase 2 family protein
MIPAGLPAWGSVLCTTSPLCACAAQALPRTIETPSAPDLNTAFMARNLDQLLTSDVAKSLPSRGVGKVFRRWWGPACSLLLLATVGWWALHQQAPRLPTDIDSLFLLLAAVLLYGVVSVVRGMRWWAILRRAGIPIGLGDAQGLLVVGYMGNTVLPARGGELLRVLLVGQRTRSSRTVVLGTVIAERLLDVLALLVLLALLALFLVRGLPVPGQLDWLVALLLVGVGLALLAAWRWLARGERARALRERLDALVLATRNLLGAQGPLLVVLTAAIWVGEGIVYWLVGQSLGLSLTAGQGCYLVVLSSLAAILPAAPGYAGTYDAAVQLGLHSLHIHAGPAVAFGLLVRLVIFAPITLVGLLLMVLRYGGLRTLRRTPRPGASGHAGLLSSRPCSEPTRYGPTAAGAQQRTS